MRPKSLLVLVALVALVASTGVAQPVVGPPNFQVTLLNSNIPIGDQFTGLAADASGNVYVLDEPSTPTAVGPRVHRIRPDGTLDPYHAVGFGDSCGELAYNPMDGLVYLVDNIPVLPVINSRVWRIEPAGGATQLYNVPVVAEGFTIDNGGQMIFGGMGTNGLGLYRFDPLSAQTTYLGPGFGNNRVLQSLVFGDILIADGRHVERWQPGVAATVPYYSAPLPNPNESNGVTSLARTPFNQIGVGALVGVRNFVTVSLGGIGRAISADLVGGNAFEFANEPYSVPFRGMYLIAGGVLQDAYWLSATASSLAGPPTAGILHRIRQLPAAGSPGSLVITQVPGVLTVDLYGPPGQFFLLGVMPDVLPVPSVLFIPPWGVVDLDVLNPLYAPVIDGVGLFGAPNPLGQIPNSGQFSLTVGIVPPPVPLAFRAQAIISGWALAPNGILYISNVATFTLP